MVRIGLILVLVFMGSCKAISGGKTSRVAERVTETYRDTSVFVPGQSVVNQLDSSFIALLRLQLESKDTVYMPSNGGQTVLKYYLNDRGELSAECESKDLMINFLIKEVERSREESQQETITVKEPVLPMWPLLIIGGQSVLVIVLLIKVIRR